MARLIRTEKEVEGRFEEVWIVVEEDPLEQWPAGPLDVVGRPAPRKDGHERVRGEARYTADLKLPGMLHAAVLRSPHAHAKVKRIDLAPALALPGVRAAIGPGEAHGPRGGGRATRARRSPPSRPTPSARRAPRSTRSTSSGRSSRSCSTRTRPSAASASPPSRGTTSAATSRRRSPRPTSSSRRPTARRPSSTTRWRRTRRSASGRATRSTSTSRRSTSGASARRSPTRSACPEDKVRVVCEYMGGGFGSKNGPDEYTFVAAELAKRTGRPVRCALTRREEHTSAGNRNATIQRLRAGARSDGTIVALEGEFTNAVGWSGWNASTEGPMQMLYDCENVRTVTYGAKINTPPMKAFRAPGLRRRDVRARVPDRRARGPARRRPARAAAPQLRGHERGHAVLLEEPRGVLPQRRAALGAPARGARAVGCRLEARRRDGEPDLVRRRRASLLRVGAARLRRPRHRDHGDAGHRHGDEDGDGADRGRGARRPARPGRRRARRLGARRRTRRSRPARRRCRRWGRPCARPRPTRASRSRTSPSSEGLPKDTPLHGDRRPAGGRADPRQGRARAEPGRHERPHVRRPRGRGRRRRRDRRGVRRARRGDPRRRTHRQSARRLEPGRGRDHPGDRPHALGGSAARPRDRPRPHDLARRVPDADDRGRARDRLRVRRQARRAPDEPRLEGARRAADRADRRRDRERDPRRDRRRRARAADLARGDAARAARRRGAQAAEKETRGAPAAV